MEDTAIGFFDNTSADNLAAAMAAMNRLTKQGVTMRAIFITGRAAHRDPAASIEERDDVYSAHIHLLNTKRMAGFLHRAGYDVPVFMGEAVYRTQLRTVIKHKHHADEHDYDARDDWHDTAIAGNFSTGLAFLRQLITKLDPGEKMLVLGGGPFTELALILRYCPDIAERLGTMAIQAGDFNQDNASNLLGGTGNSFNGACDAAALRDVLFDHAGNVYILPSNITKQPELGFKTPDEIAALGAYRELVDVYRVHYEHSAKPRGASLYIHDLGLVMLVDQLLSDTPDFPYHYTSVEIVDVPCGAPLAGQPERRGTITIRPAAASNRYVVTQQDTARYRDRAAVYLQN